MRKVDKILVDSASPETCAAILLSMKTGKVIKKEDIFNKVKDRNIIVNSSLFRPLNRLRDLGLIIEVSKDERALTPFGDSCKNVLIEDRDLFFELMHYLHIRAAFDEKMDGYFLTYYLISKYLYTKNEVGDQRLLLSSVLSEIEENFGSDNIKSIDKSSISKVISWLKILKPSFETEDKHFLPRQNVKPHVLLMATSAYYEKIHLPFGTAIMLDKNTTESISTLGLVDSSFFSSNIATTATLFSNLQLSGTVDGKALVLRKRFDVEDIV